jgi:tRNA pseudouridine38-40 synthase
VIAFNAIWRHPLEDLQRALNALLPEDIVIRELSLTKPSFHPRFEAISRTYCYQIVNQPWPAVLLRRYVYHLNRPLDVTAMNQASRFLLGQHDFASFGRPPQGHNTVRMLSEATWTAKESQVTFRITANAFLYRMVRTIVGTLAQVGLGHLQIDDVKRILEAKDLTRSAPPAPAHGLCLVSVTYPEDV